MATKATLASSTTNTTYNSCKVVTCSCSILWELYQQEAYIRLATKKPGEDDTYKLEEMYETRARRIAATYARIYLEKDRCSKQKLKGRYYWMGLGAFASKTVAAVLDSWFTRGGYQTNKIAPSITNSAKIALRRSKSNYTEDEVDEIAEKAPKSVHIFAKGNLWLFMEVAPWHWSWSESPEDFELCKTSRNSQDFQHEPVKKALNSLPWAGSALPKINYLKISDEINDAFKTLPVIEAGPIYGGEKKVVKKQYQQLIDIAKNEQKNILQNICWNHADMIAGAKLQRTMMVPFNYMLMHSHYSDYTHTIRWWHNDLPETPYSDPPEDMIVENYDSRMDWIVQVADKYHKLMQDEVGRPYMEEQLGIIAGWWQDASGKTADKYSNDPAK